jgi:3-phosphoshikimate 1-carboxyvinyltransferase
MARRRFAPASALAGAVVAPADKSISHRAALIAAMGDGACRISRYLDAADTRSTLGAIESLGAAVRVDGDPGGSLSVEIEGVGLRGPRASAPIDVGNAGTLIRLITGWLAGQEGRSFELDGDDSIRARPMGRIADPLTEMGARIATRDGSAPLRVEGAALAGIDHTLAVASAQVKSCLLFAGLLAEGSTTVREPQPTRDHTERMLAAAGASIDSVPRTALPTGPSPAAVTVEPAERLALPDLTVPGDLSSAAFQIAAGLLVPGSAVRVEGVGLNPTRVGLLGVLNRMGARIEVEETGWQAGEPVGSITARHGELRATRVSGSEVPLAIDELPLVALLGCFAEGETTVADAQELRHKESDRIATVVEGLGAVGAEIEATDDGFVVSGTGSLVGGTIESAGDHRIAMLGAVAGLASDRGVDVDGIEAAEVSYPGFESDLAALGA